jgi:hypothetical protein
MLIKKGNQVKYFLRDVKVEKKRVVLLLKKRRQVIDPYMFNCDILEFRVYICLRWEIMG